MNTFCLYLMSYCECPLKLGGNQRPNGGYISTHSLCLILLQGMQILIPAFLIVAFAYKQTLFYIGLLLFSFGELEIQRNLFCAVKILFQRLAGDRLMRVPLYFEIILIFSL